MARGLTLNEVRDIRAQWGRFGPPVYISMAAQVGWKPKQEASQEAAFDEMIALLGGGGA